MLFQFLLLTLHWLDDKYLSVGPLSFNYRRKLKMRNVKPAMMVSGLLEEKLVML